MKRFCVLLLTTVLLMAESAAQAEESFFLDGTSYTLPFALAELLDDGWEINHPEEILSPGSYTLADELRRGSTSCQVQIINLSMNDQQKRDCYVGQITFTKDFAEDVILPGGLALSNSWKTVYDQLAGTFSVRRHGWLSAPPAESALPEKYTVRSTLCPVPSQRTAA